MNNLLISRLVTFQKQHADIYNVNAHFLMEYRIFGQDGPLTEQQQQEIKQIDMSPLQFLPQLIEASKIKDHPSPLNLSGKQICDTTTQEMLDKGKKVLDDKRAALFIMAGGAATRLGADVPKGAYQLNIPGCLCLFEGILNKCKNLGSPRIIIMLSSATKSTEKFMDENNYFGYDKSLVEFVYQPEYPVMSENQQLLLDKDGHIQTSPNGNGGFLKAISKINFDGLDYLHVIGVDNLFVKPLDPAMIGFAVINGFEVVNRCLRPEENEKVGIAGMRTMTLQSQAPLCPEKIEKLLQIPAVSVFEYSEIDMSKVDKNNMYANIANHLFDVKLLKQLIDIQEVSGAYITPYHLAHKKVPYLDSRTGEIIKPNTPNAYKVEHFIFDYFHFCNPSRFGIFISVRDEFLPIKESTDIQRVKEKWIHEQHQQIY